jgi:hypothetical protein
MAALLAGVRLGYPSAPRRQRQSGIQLSPQSNRYFISKDVGQERWAITYNLGDKTVTGNVFPLSGGAPTFLTCNITGVEQAPNPADAQYTLDCFVAGPCASATWLPRGAPGASPVPGSSCCPPPPPPTRAMSVDLQRLVRRDRHPTEQPGRLAADVSYANTFNVESSGVNGDQAPIAVPAGLEPLADEGRGNRGGRPDAA